MLRTKHAALHLQGLAEERLGLSILPKKIGNLSQFDCGSEGLRVFSPQHLAAQIQCLLQLLARFRVQAEVRIRLSDGKTNSSFHLRLLFEPIPDALGRTVQRSPHLQVGIRFCLWARLFVGAGLRQQIVLQKVNYSLGSCSLGLRVQLRSPRPNCLPRADYNADDERDEYRPDPRYQHLVAPRELSQLVAG